MKTREEKKEILINRRKFSEKLGIGSASILLATYCSGLTSCRRTPPLAPKSPTIDDTDKNKHITIQLNSDLAKDLNDNAKRYIVVDEVVIARNNNNEYKAVTQWCSHERLSQIIYFNEEFICTAHGARFEQTGKGLNLLASGGLVRYNTQLNPTNNTLTISKKV